MRCKPLQGLDFDLMWIDARCGEAQILPTILLTRFLL